MSTKTSGKPLTETDYPDWVWLMANDLAALPEAHMPERLARVLWFLHSIGCAHGIESVARCLEEDYSRFGVSQGLPPKGEPIPLGKLLSFLMATAAEFRMVIPQEVHIIPDELLPPEEQAPPLPGRDGTGVLLRLLASGVKQAEIIKRAGIDTGTLSRAFTGKARLGPKSTERLRAAYPEAFMPPIDPSVSP